MEKHNMIALSTGHVSRETAELMDDDSIDGVVLYNKAATAGSCISPMKE